MLLPGVTSRSLWPLSQGGHGSSKWLMLIRSFQLTTSSGALSSGRARKYGAVLKQPDKEKTASSLDVPKTDHILAEAQWAERAKGTQAESV